MYCVFLAMKVLANSSLATLLSPHSAKVWRPPSPASEGDPSSSSTSSDRRRTNQAGAMIGTEAASIT